MPLTYKAVVVGCSRMGAFIDNEIPLKQVAPMDAKPDEPISTLGTPMRIKGGYWLPMSHSAAYEACDRVDADRSLILFAEMAAMAQAAE